MLATARQTTKKAATKKAAPPRKIQADDVVDSLTGNDEAEIKAAFGTSFNKLGEDGAMFLRALLFIVRRREGAKRDQAYKAAMDLTMKDLDALFVKTEG